MKLVGALICGVVLSGCLPRTGQTGAVPSDWVATWEAAPQLVEPRNLPPPPGLSGNTLRQVIHLAPGGSRWRIRLSNEFGDGSLIVAAAHAARSAGADALIPGTDVQLRFGGGASVTIPAGAAVLSDPFDLRVSALSELAVSLNISTAPTAITGHPGSRTTSFIVAGDRVTDERLPDGVRTEHWYVISGVQRLAPAGSGAVVVLGNSIVDGRGSGTDRNNRWTDNLARRFQELGETAGISVLNAGIGGNAVVRGGLGPTALARFERDVVSQPGARWVIVSEGVNDIGTAPGADSSASMARQLIEAYRHLVRRAHDRGLRVYGATILPFGGAAYGTPEHEAARATVNRWIRESGAFDAVIDLDGVMRDPADHSRLRPDADGGDHLHPNELGYRLIADAVDLSWFTVRR